MGGLLLSIDPFGIGSFTEEGSQRVLYDVGGPIYESTAQEDITIVLVSEQSLRALYELNVSGTNDWPLLYQDWGLILRTVAAHSPRAIFVDVLFEQERITDLTLPILFSALRRLDGRVPVYFAAGLPPYSGSLLQQLADRANLGGSAWEGYGNGVPLVQAGQNMASVELYKLACGAKSMPLPGCKGNDSWLSHISDSSPAMSIIWGSQGMLPLTAELEGKRSGDFCRNDTAAFTDFFKRLLKSAAGDWAPDFLSNDGHQCLFHRVIDVDELFYVFDHGSEAERSVLNDALRNKVVLIGTWFNGLPDAVDTPTMGQVPGVALHAMMLDNLMSYGPDYVRTAEGDAIFYNLGAWALIVLFLVGWMGCREYRSQPGADRVSFVGTEGTCFLLVSIVLVSISAVLTVVVLRLEPANAFGFLGLAEVTRRINVTWEDKWFQIFRNCRSKLTDRGRKKP